MVEELDGCAALGRDELLAPAPRQVPRHRLSLAQEPAPVISRSTARLHSSRAETNESTMRCVKQSCCSAATAVARRVRRRRRAASAARPRPARRRRSAAPASAAGRRVRRRRDRRRAPPMSNAVGRGSRLIRASPIPAAAFRFTVAQFGGRERLRGARRLCLHHPPADGADGRRGRARLRARPRGRAYRRQPRPAARSGRAGAIRSGVLAAQILGSVLGGGFGNVIAQMSQQRRAAADAELLARPGISGRHARHPLSDRRRLRSGRRRRASSPRWPRDARSRRGSRAAPTARRPNGRAPTR